MHPIPQRTTGKLPARYRPDHTAILSRNILNCYEPDRLNSLAHQNLRAGRIQEAIWCLSRLADCYQRNGQADECLRVLRRLSSLRPADSAIAIRIGDILAERGLVTEARASYIGAGDSQYMIDQPEAAIEAYQKAIDLDPSNAALLSMLGGLYLECGLHKQAHHSFTNARREYLKAGQVGLAREAAKRAHSIEVGDNSGAFSEGLNKRKEVRYTLRVRTCVVSENWNWREYTESLNISKSGIRCSLKHPVERDSVIRVHLYVPPELKLYGGDHSLYSADAMVCHAEHTEDGTYLVGAEFGYVSPIIVE
jgi:tetratricopeptide (TPR) repeat protein